MILLMIWALATGCAHRGKIEEGAVIDKETYENPLFEIYYDGSE